MIRNTKLSIKDAYFYLNDKLVNEGTPFSGSLTNFMLDMSKDIKDIKKDIDNINADTFTIRLQSDIGLQSDIKAFDLNGELNIFCMNKIEQILDYIDLYEYAAILELFNISQEQSIQEEHIRAAITNIINWIDSKKYTNIALEIANNSSKKYSYDSLRPRHIYEYVDTAQKTASNKYYISASVDLGVSSHVNINDIIRLLRCADFSILHSSNSSGFDINIQDIIENSKKPMVLDFVFNDFV